MNLPDHPYAPIHAARCAFAVVVAVLLCIPVGCAESPQAARSSRDQVVYVDYMSTAWSPAWAFAEADAVLLGTVTSVGGPRRFAALAGGEPNQLLAAAMVDWYGEMELAVERWFGGGEPQSLVVIGFHGNGTLEEGGQAVHLRLSTAPSFRQGQRVVLPVSVKSNSETAHGEAGPALWLLCAPGAFVVNDKDVASHVVPGPMGADIAAGETSYPLEELLAFAEAAGLAEVAVP